jgi:DNA topoisomerase-2
LIFHPDDDKLLNYLDDDGLLVEPEFYVPIIPMSLVNGSEGIGTGWSTSVPNYNPKDIVENIKRMLRNEAPKEMLPWYRGFEVSP